MHQVSVQKVKCKTSLVLKENANEILRDLCNKQRIDYPHIDFDGAWICHKADNMKNNTNRFSNINFQYKNNDCMDNKLQSNIQKTKYKLKLKRKEPQKITINDNLLHELTDQSGQCPECIGFKFQTVDQFYQHYFDTKQTHNNYTTNKLRYKCSECQMLFKRQRNLMHHKTKYCKGSKSVKYWRDFVLFKCKLCRNSNKKSRKEAFLFKQHMKQHLRTVHKEQIALHSI